VFPGDIVPTISIATAVAESYIVVIVLFGPRDDNLMVACFVEQLQGLIVYLVDIEKPRPLTSSACQAHCLFLLGGH
jgi:hypothetical protein